MINLRISAFLALLTAGFLISFFFSMDWEKRLKIQPLEGDVFYSQSSGDQDSQEDENEDEGYSGEILRGRKEAGTSQKIWKKGGELNASYNFVNFNRDKLNVSFSFPEARYREYMSGYGYTDEEYEQLKSWRSNTLRQAWEKAYKQGGRAAADRAGHEVELEYDTRLRALLYRRGLALRAGNVVTCDMPNIVKRNVGELKPLALAIQKQAKESGYGFDDTVGAAVSLVQTAMRYRVPPSKKGSLHTCGILPPVSSLLSGWGDCDTKTGVLASILGNWSGVKMLGVSVPGHYLMAIRRIPAKGELFVRHEGLEYVLIEPAGPAWLSPGRVGDSTMALLKGSQGYTLEPFF